VYVGHKVGPIQNREPLGLNRIRVYNNIIEKTVEAISSQNMMNKSKNFITSIRKIMKSSRN
jgi:hypothetical protein